MLALLVVELVRPPDKGQGRCSTGLPDPWPSGRDHLRAGGAKGLFRARISRLPRPSLSPFMCSPVSGALWLFTGWPLSIWRQSSFLSFIVVCICDVLYKSAPLITYRPYESFLSPSRGPQSFFDFFQSKSEPCSPAPK